MNRAERRRLARQGAKQPVAYSYTQEELERIKRTAIHEYATERDNSVKSVIETDLRDALANIKEEAAANAANQALILMLSIPVLIISKHYGSLMRKQANGLSRPERFANLIIQYYRDFEDGKYELEDFAKILYDETGIEFVEEEVTNDNKGDS